ncbi:MAG: PAS-domain containing protein [Xanthomonadaceae bacterium]|nr:PAS-domain containing protein [Xanthomonadaceae bacterium]
MRKPRWNRATLLLLLLVAGGTAAAAWLAFHWAEARTLREESAQLQRELDLHARAIQQAIDRYRTLPRVLALDEALRGAVAGTIDPAWRDRLNRRLEEANGVTRTSTLTLIDRRGIALAASNWREPTSNVGADYHFRPYVQQALRTGQGQFYGIGLTTGEPGYFLSEAIRDDDGGAIGVIVIKIELAALQEGWRSLPDVVMVSDRHDVVFLANRDAWRYRSLSPLDPAERRELEATRQYEGQALEPIQVGARLAVGPGTDEVRTTSPAMPGSVLWQTLPLPEQGWTLHLLHDAGGIAPAARTAALAAGGACLALGFLLLIVQQRRRLSALRLRSREELEAVLRQHAEELRTAQDVIVETARRADAGLSRSLEHLPQGVVIVDADLKLVAWNSRYVELFRFPAEMLRVGQPIEAMFRFNAQRGLLGPGPIEDAIQRRLDHLRGGKAHLRETEKADGTVLEIRGNPLPDGGFVTSYADITSYRNAARELRSLADSLERRVGERTRALAAAKQDAERANRYKTRFVAAAVHDLLQPLNAARMLLGALRGREGDGESRRIVDHVEQSLLAQDAILNSLLDISRLESGAMATRLRDFPLDPLLEALAREFGILALDRGLRLARVATRAVVRTDEALLRRIVQNFLSNAVRYTPSGRILLGCRRVRGGVRIEVHDQGPGIPESLQREVFEEFRRLNDGVANDRGAGLGLAIVERIGRLLDHPIGLRSTLGAGSVFSVLVPFAPAGATVAEAAAPVEDGDDARVCEATRTLLRRWDCEVAFSAGPHDALLVAAPGNGPDVLLLDARLGDTSGFALHPRLCERWGRIPPTILITATRDEALRARAVELGWGILTKPVRPSALRSLMMQLLLRHAPLSPKAYEQR